jgi:hypothetical protein
MSRTASGNAFAACSFFANICRSARIVRRGAISCAIARCAPRLVAAARERFGVARQRLGHARAFERGGDELLPELVRAARGSELERHRLQPGQSLLDVLCLFAELQHEETPQPRAMRLCRFLRRVEDLEVDGAGAIDERRVADKRLRAALHLHQLRQLAERPVGEPRQRGLRARDFGELLAGLVAQLRAELGEVASHCQLAAVLVQDAEVHREMRRERLRPEAVGRQREVPALARVTRDRLRKRIAGRHGGDELRGELGERPELVPHLLRQRLREELHLVLHEPGHEPLAARGAHLVERDQRHGHRHAVARSARVV